jgi:hypothetical protein
MNNWLVPVIGLCGIILGSFLQFLYTKLIDTNRRSREVRGKRIDKVEEAINYSIKSSWKILKVCDEEIKETPDNKLVEKLLVDNVSENHDTDYLDIRLLIASGESLHDKVLNKFIDEMVEFKEETLKIGDSIFYLHIKNKKDEKKNLEPKLSSMHSDSLNLLSRIYERLDYLRSE